MATTPSFDSEWLYMLGLGVAAFVAGAVGYLRRPRPSAGTDPVLASLGLELGNRHQIDQLIVETKRTADELKRIADAITDHQATVVTSRLDDQTEVLEKLAAMVEKVLTERPRR